MPKYRVTLTTTASITATVEADSGEAATDEIFDMVPSEVCAQCSGWGQPWGLDLGEWEIETDENGKEIGFEEITTNTEAEQ